MRNVLGIALPANHQPIPLLNWQRLEQQAVHNAKQRGSRCNPKGKNQDGQEKESSLSTISRVACENVRTELEIVFSIAPSYRCRPCLSQRHLIAEPL
jgi:hypothetical protein